LQLSANIILAAISLICSFCGWYRDENTLKLEEKAMNFKKLLTVSTLTLLPLTATLIAQKAQAVPVYIYVSDPNSVTQIRDGSGNVVNMPIRVVNTEEAFTQPGYRSNSPWCRLYGTSVNTECTPSAIYTQINQSAAFKDCGKYIGDIKPVWCQSPEDRQLRDSIRFTQPGQ
jgi:hypothetical protein